MRSRVPAWLRVVCAALAVGAAVAGCGTTTVVHVTRTITRAATGSASGSGSGGGTESGSGSGTATGTDTGSGTGTRSGAGTATASSGSRAGTATSGARSGRAAALVRRPPRAIIGAAAAALKRAGSYAMTADLVQGGSRTQIGLTTTGPRTFDATLSTGAATFDVIEVAGRAYLRGNRAFWSRHAAATAAGRARAAQLAGHWLQVPATGRNSVTQSLGTLSPATLGRCLTEDHGSLSVGGVRTVDGVRAVVVRDAGNVPGSTPSSITVAASGPPYPLRYVATGATRAGGRVDVCNDGKGDGATGTITLNQFGRVPTIHAPVSVGGGTGGTQA